MALRDLFFRITAKDETSAAFSSVKKGLAGVDGAARTVRDRMRGIGRTAGVAGAAATAGLTAPLIAGLRSSLALFQEQEAAESQVAQAIRSTGEAAGFTADELFRQASALQDLSAVGDEKILESVTAQLLTFGNIAGENFRAAQVAALDLSAALKTDLRSQTIQLGKALNDPVKGITALSRAGVQFTEDQKAVIKALAETGQVAEAQKIILQEISTFYGGQAATAAGTLKGRLADLSNVWGDLKEQFGAVLADLLPPLIAGLKGLISAFQATPEPVKRVAVGVGLVAAAIGPVVGVVGLLALGMSALAAPVLAAAGAIAAATAALVAFWPEIVKTGQFLRDLADGAIAYVKRKLGELVSFVEGVGEAIIAPFKRAYDVLVGNSIIPDLVDETLAEFRRLEGGAVGAAEATASQVESVFGDMARGVVGIFTDMAKQGRFSLAGLGQGLLNIGGNVAGRIAGQGADFLAGQAAGALGLPGFANGADFTVGGAAGRDRNLVAFMASRGERVQVTPAGQGGGASVVVNISTPDAESFRRSSGQVASDIARAVARGQRRL